MVETPLGLVSSRRRRLALSPGGPDDFQARHVDFLSVVSIGYDPVDRGEYLGAFADVEFGAGAVVGGLDKHHLTVGGASQIAAADASVDVYTHNHARSAVPMGMLERLGDGARIVWVDGRWKGDEGALEGVEFGVRISLL